MLQYLKLGGSLITDKDQPHTLRGEVLTRIAREIAQFLREHPEERLLLGHGSGSFGHVPARQHTTREGVRSPENWRGFHQVWREARALNLVVMDALLEQGVQAVSFAPSSTVSTSSREIISWNMEPIRSALAHGLVPVVYGDVVFDQALGGTILSTEDLFIHLAHCIQPARILLAGIDAGVWQDYPSKDKLIASISPDDFPAIRSHLDGSRSTDVTGGMLSKVKLMVDLVAQIPQLECRIFDGLQPEFVYHALCGKNFGTRIAASGKT